MPLLSFIRLPLSRATLVVLLAGWLTACSTWTSSNFQAPDVQLVDAELVYARLLEQQVMLEFRIDNPNNKSLPVRSVSYDIQLNGIPLGRGQNSQWLAVPAGGHSYIKVPVHTNLWRHVKGLAKALDNPSRPIEYSLQAQIQTGLMFNKSVPVRRQGSFVPGDYLSR